ncbi:DHA2 family efflux MFS transporter permease subunit [Alishewanella sp. d11]|uniref:DHA2 family efflux MFS transporter permease subunit n=1 Tax=Alishewanella sp. d11 TaxID=3414030 RepID=UPI003BF783B5
MKIPDAAVSLDPNFTEGVKWAVVIAVVLTAVLEVLDSTIVNVALPHIQAAFGTTSNQTIWIATSYIVASVAVMPLTGLLAKQFGRRRLINTAIIGFACFSVLAGFTSSIELMVVCRLGQGLFGAFLIPLSQSILFQTFSKENRGQAMALFGLGVVVAPVLGPTLGAMLTEHFSWRAVFFVNLPIAVLALTMIKGELPEERRKEVKIDWTGLFLMVLAIAALQITLDLGENREWFNSHLIQVTALLTLIFGIAFIWRGNRTASNIIDFGLFRDKSFAIANIAIMVFSFAMFGAMTILPMFVQGLMGYPILDAGYMFIPRGIAAGFSMVFTGIVLIKLVDPRGLMVLGLLLTGFGNILLTNLTLSASFWDLAMPGVISGLGMGLFFVPMSTLAFQNITAAQQDEASGIYGVTRSIGSSIGIAIIGWQVTERTGFHSSILLSEVSVFNPNFVNWVAPLGMGIHQPTALQLAAAEVAKQASLLAFQDAFFLAGMAAFCMIPLAFLMQRPQQQRIAMAH